MAKSSISNLEKVIGGRFRKRKALLAALTHPSYPTQVDHSKAALTFQRMEFLGDSILNLFIARRLYTLFPDANEGLLSRMRSILVSRRLLARLARSIRLKSALRLGARERSQSAIAIEKIMADAFEALIAAIYFDRGVKKTEAFLAKCFSPHFNQKKLFRFDPNSKSLLQEHVQKKFHRLPAYRAKRYLNGSFIAWVTIKKSLGARGKGRTKQEAETQAASALLKKLKITPATSRS